MVTWCQSWDHICINYVRTICLEYLQLCEIERYALPLDSILCIDVGMAPMCGWRLDGVIMSALMDLKYVYTYYWEYYFLLLYVYFYLK